ncbi:MAG: hypothetical protein JZU52_13050 [Lamprocystis purpurea]|jgi:hypothetical protein|uniref:hypothetical protein n=1 Tax=Lamprocystis purpurea TaxID=61598 RepID=UPI00035E5F3D|nr:hypothetical protein [Lamprocystis purpurea]MBV5274521.1 hypothetical protein [Lamprocystis purpurea]
MNSADQYDLPLEVIVLLIYGTFMCLFGVLLHWIFAGALPYAPDSMYGLSLVLIAFQIVTLGRTPFGDLRRSWTLVAIGIGTAVIGMVGSFVPGHFSGTLRVLVGLLMTGGGAALLYQYAARADQARAWLKGPGILRVLAFSAASVYLLTLIAGLLTLLPGITKGPHTAILLIIYGISFLSLAWTLHEVGKAYGPETIHARPTQVSPPGHLRDAHRRLSRDAQLPLTVAIILLQAVLLTLLGILLFPVGVGLLPFSPDGQHGLTLVITAIQIIALGSTPVGEYRRSWLMVLFGMLFAALGIFSSIVPGVITGQTGLLLGLLNLVGGFLGLFRGLLSMLRRRRNPGAQQADAVPPILRLLALIPTMIAVVQIVFGLSIFLPTLLPAKVGAAMLVVNGLLLFALAGMVLKLSRLGKDPAAASAAAPTPAAAPRASDR